MPRKLLVEMMVNMQGMTQAHMPSSVLVIDDDENVVELMRISLRRLGLLVYGARSGEEGLDLFNQVGPDLVTLDVLMPGMDGWEVCRRLRQVSDVPIVFVSVMCGEHDVVRALNGGADDFVAKPFDVSELGARVVAVLRRTCKVRSSRTRRSRTMSAAQVGFRAAQ